MPTSPPPSKTSGGFTLVEMLVTLVIMALLAGLATLSAGGNAQRAARDETNDLLRRLVASNAELKAEVTALKKSNEAGAKAAEKTADTLVNVTRGGRAIQTEAFT